MTNKSISEEEVNSLFQQQIPYSRREERAALLRRGELQQATYLNQDANQVSESLERRVDVPNDAEEQHTRPQSTMQLISYSTEVVHPHNTVSSAVPVKDVFEIPSAMPRRDRASLIQRGPRRLTGRTSNREEKLKLLKRERKFNQGSQSTIYSTESSQESHESFMRPQMRDFEVPAPREVSRRNQRRLPVRRVVRDGRLVQSEREFIIGKRSNIYVNKSTLNRDAFGAINPTEYFSQIYNTKPIRGGIFLDSDSASTTSDEWSSSTTESDVASSDMSSAITSFKDDESSSVISNGESSVYSSRDASSIERMPYRLFRGLHPVPRDPRPTIHEQLEKKNDTFRDQTTDIASVDDDTSHISNIIPSTIDEDHLFPKAVDITRDSGFTSPNPPNISYDIGYLPPTPGDKSSIHSIPGQVAYSPNLDDLDESKVNRTGDYSSYESESDKEKQHRRHDQTSDLSSDLSPSKRKLDESRRTESLLRTPSDDEDTPETPSRKISQNQMQIPNMDLSDIESSDSRKRADQTIDLGRRNEVDFLGGVVFQLDKTPGNLKRRRVEEDDTSTNETDDSAMEITPHHVYKSIKYRPQYRDLKDSDEEDDAEYIERYNDDSDDETYRDPNPYPHRDRIIRRSNRTRLPPLRRWMNEMADPETKQLIIPRTPPVSRKRRKREVTTVVDEKNGIFLVNENGRPRESFVAASKRMIIQKMSHFAYESNNQESYDITGHGKMSLTTVFSKDSMKAGSIIIHPMAIKPQQNSGGFRHVFTVLNGYIEVNLFPDGDQKSGETFKAYSGSMFYIPPHNSFLMRNPSNTQQCMLTFVVTKA